MTFGMPNVRRRYAALAACSLIATVLPLSAMAEYGIPAGTGAVVTSGQPLTVRVSPGWDAPVSYEIADGSYVTVWDVAQTAPDGSLWYPVDGGYVPAEGVTSQATLDGGVALYQDAAPEAQTQDLSASSTNDVWLDPASTQGWVDPNTGQWVDAATSQGWVDPNTGQWVDPAASQGWVDPNTGQWVDPATSQGWVDPNTGLDPTTSQGWVDPNTGQWIDATKSQEWTDSTGTSGWVDPNSGQWVDTSTAQGWVDPNTGQWVDATTSQNDVATQDLADPNAAQPVDASSLQGWVDPNTGQWVDPTTAQGWVDSNTGQWVDANAAQPAIADDGSVALAQEAVNADGLADPAPENSGGVESWGEPIGTAYISGTNGDGAVCRPAPERGGGKLAVLGDGDTVEVRGEAVGEWQPVNCAGVGGYINTSFLAWQPVELEQHGRHDHNNDGNDGNGGGKVNDSQPVPSGGGGGGSGSGQQIASFAQQYLGYPYAYAGEGPYAFDCSGFTKFVIQNTVGIDITHDMFTQIGMGQSVGESDLQPGDLVFFANTFRPGLSHAGVYVGGGQFVHAENESTGVVQSDLFSDYYGSRWYGGTRIGG